MWQSFSAVSGNHIEGAPNALPLSCAAPIERESVEPKPAVKIDPISLDAQRPQLQRLVGRAAPG
jgi:hypothetical protein